MVEVALEQAVGQFLGILITGLALFVMLMALNLLRRGTVALVKFAESRMSAEQFARAKDVIRTLVLAAEQIGLTSELFKHGEAKKNYVISLAEEELRKLGITLDRAQLDRMVEGIVYDEFNRFKIEVAEIVSQ